jgi:hypothetical protein
LLSSVTEACETVSNAVKSDRARLFYEENISGANGTSRAHEISEDDSSEDDGAKPFIHVGAGTVPSFLDSHLHSTRYKITVSNIKVYIRTLKICYEFKEHATVVVL